MHAALRAVTRLILFNLGVHGASIDHFFFLKADFKNWPNGLVKKLNPAPGGTGFNFNNN
jgi:hypothetical protein